MLNVGDIVVCGHSHCGALRLHTWFFKIATAELFAFDPDIRQFTPLPT